MTFKYTPRGCADAKAYLESKLSQYEYHVAINQDGYSIVSLANYHHDQEQVHHHIETYTDIQLLAELIRRTVLYPAPRSRGYGTPHKEITVGIGPDHIATITLEQDALVELHDLIEGGC
jgi:hypothetical protein